MIGKNLLEILACPKCKGNVRHEKKAGVLVCEHCRLKFKVLDGVPNMLLKDADAL